MKLLLGLVTLGINLLPLVTIIILFYYVMQLEKDTCNCIKDWRHDFLKYMLFSNVILSIINVVLLTTNIISFNIYKTILTLITIVSVINTYCYFTYVTDLNKTKCNCLKDMPKFNQFLNVMKWLFVAITSVSVVAVPFYLNRDLKVKNKLI